MPVLTKPLPFSEIQRLIRLEPEAAATEIPLAMARLGKLLGDLVTERDVLNADRKHYRACEYSTMLSIDSKAAEWKLRARFESLETFAASLHKVAILDGHIETAQRQLETLSERTTLQQLATIHARTNDDAN
jgi:hypothetical protein